VPINGVLLVGISVKAAVLSTALTALNGVGMMSIRGFFGSDDEEEDGGDGDDGGMVFDESVEGMDDGGLGEFDDMDDDWGDDSGDGGGSVGELENRVDEIENELASVSSTVSTVKSENEEISESVDEIEDNVRKLLDIYEMVTRGVNPFVDDAQQGSAFDDGSFGLFEDEQSAEPEDENLDDDIVSAEAESFFDDDFDGDGAGDDFAEGGGGGDPFEDDGDGFEDDGFGDDTFEDGEEADPLEDDPEDGGGTGKSFDELKSEYESGDANWAEGEAPEDAEDGQSVPDTPEEDGDDAVEAADADGFEDAADARFDDADDAFSGGAFDEAAEDDEFGATGGFDEEAEEAADPTEDPSADPTPEDSTEEPGDPTPEEPAAGTTAGTAMTDGAALGEEGDEWESPTEEPSADAMAMPSSERPYLTDLQNGYVSDMVVMEWLTYLVEESDPLEAHRAIKYYEDVEWIDETVADRLWNFLDGFPRDGPEDALPPRRDMSYPSELTVDHHIRSLSFIANLAGDQERELFDRWNHRGEPNALKH
jgi:archaellum component FlaD/FlaE/archaellum component FlaC